MKFWGSAKIGISGPLLSFKSNKSANQDLQNRLLNLESANLMQELQSINNKCIAKTGFVDNKYEYLMDRTLTLQSEVVATQTLCKEERLSLIDKIRFLESCVSEEHNRWYDSMKNLESQAREEVHSLEQTLCARLQALEETLCKHDKEPNKQKGKTIKVITSPNGSNPMAYPVIIHERPADDTHREPYVTRTLQPISIRDFKNMKEAIVTYGIHSTYVKQMLNSWSTSNRIIPDDWHQLTSAVLEYSQQLQWKSWLREEARNLEQQGKLRGFEISQDQILGEGHFANRNIQATYDEHTISLCCTAALNAWEKIPEPGKQTEEDDMYVMHGIFFTANHAIRSVTGGTSGEAEGLTGDTAEAAAALQPSDFTAESCGQWIPAPAVPGHQRDALMVLGPELLTLSGLSTLLARNNRLGGSGSMPKGLPQSLLCGSL
ncbi:hypothetical protein STEG23_032269 [Scotinomys teguina]